MLPARNSFQMAQPWRVLQSSRKAKVDLPMTLCGGQCFRWHRTPNDHFVGVIGRRVYELSRTAPTAAPTATEAHAVHYRLLGSFEPSDTSPALSQKPQGSRVRRRSLAATDPQKISVVSDEDLLSSYLSLDVDLPGLWATWTHQNPMKGHPLVSYLTQDPDTSDRRPTEPFANIRHLRQDVHETLFSFICSQNNHVKRITTMVNDVCNTYGSPICTVPLAEPSVVAIDAKQASRSGKKRQRTESKDSLLLSTFPTIPQLQGASEDALRRMGFGYRSKFIVGCVAAIIAYQSPQDTSTAPASQHPLPPRAVDGSGVMQHHASTLSIPFYRDLVCAGSVQAQREMLLTLPGVGRKVADCVLLFALGHVDLVPVDTHMAQVASEYLSPVTTKPRTKGKGSAATKGTVTPGVDWQAVVREWRAKGVAKAKKAKKQLRPTAQSNKRSSSSSSSSSLSKSPAKASAAPPALAEKHHDAIQEGFRQLFGPYAGWAHSIVFYKRMR